MYIRLSVAWAAVAQYANDNRESCHISIPSLNEFEQYHRGAVKDRVGGIARRESQIMLRPCGATPDWRIVFFTFRR